MLRSILAVIAGFVVTVLLVMLITSGGAALLGVAAGVPTPEYLVLNLVAGLLAGVAGGMVTARLARGWLWRHVGSLAAVLLVLAIPFALQPPAPGQPAWYPLMLVVLGPVAVALGGWLVLRRRLGRGGVAALVALAALAACAPVRSGEGTAVEADRLLRHVEVLAADSMLGRRTGTAGGERARRYVVQQFRQLGLEPVGGSLEHPFTFVGRRDSLTYRGVNVLGQVRGTRHPDRYIVITAHYDHVGVGRPVEGDSIYNGADDNASGTAALLELARHFQRRRPAATLIFAALDAEEMGLQGANALVTSPPIPRDAIVLNVNMDMVSHSESGELFAAGTSHSPYLAPLLEAVAARAPVQLRLGHDLPVPTPADDWTLQSDHGAFHRAGIPFVYFGVEDHPDYHRPSDELRTITPDFFVAAVRTIADALRTLDANVEEIVRQRAATAPQ